MDTVTQNEDSSLNIQNEYFNNARKNRTRITVFLTNGQRITGLIRSFDKFTVILETRNGDQMIFKHAITTVATALPMDRDVRGPRPARPGVGERGGEGRPHGPQGRPPHGGPGAPHGGGPREGAPGGQQRDGGPRQDDATRPRGGAAPQGKQFGNFMDLSAISKAPGAAPHGPPPADAAPREAPPEPAPEPASAPADQPDGAEAGKP